ncbi:hypothetical protein BH09ACT1_BH09ACT1_11920 [soil metagenome]
MTAQLTPVERRKRRRRILGWIPYVAMAVIIVVIVVFSVMFNSSWWREGHPAASVGQRYQGQSIFTQGGVDYDGKQGLVIISLAADRPDADDLGLPSSGSRTIRYIVPLTIRIDAGQSAIREKLVDTVTLQTAGGRVSAVRFTDNRAYSDMYSHAVELMAATGGDRAAFDAALESTRVASSDKSYDAVSTTVKGGIRTRLELAGTPSTAKLRIAFTPA